MPTADREFRVDSARENIPAGSLDTPGRFHGSRYAEGSTRMRDLAVMPGARSLP